MKTLLNISAGLSLGLLLAVPRMAVAQNQNNPECLGTDCGAPKEEGGGCGCGCGCSVWVSYTDQGKTLSYTDDTDGDGIPDALDNCPFVANSDQKDTDGDGIGDVCDNCAAMANPDQKDTNGNGIGDICDADLDGDGVPDKALVKNAAGQVTSTSAITSGPNDNCPNIPNPSQKITCSSLSSGCLAVATLGDACNPDIDGDGIINSEDLCPYFAGSVANHGQPSPIPAGVICKIDTDGDGVDDSYDNCPTIANADQHDINGNGIGDVCDPDQDGDGIADKKLVTSTATSMTFAAIPVEQGGDNCPSVANHDQLDSWNALVGDACNPHACFVVDRNSPSDCLDPLGSFAVNAGVEATIQSGQPLVLPLWANRKNAAIQYSWTVTQRPAGSSAAIVNPKGAATMSQEWQYVYVNGQVPTFSPDVNGTYQIQLSANLVFPDRAYPTANSSQAVITVTASDTDSSSTLAAPPSSGCSSTGAAGFAPLLGTLLGLGLILRRRQK